MRETAGCLKQTKPPAGCLKASASTKLKPKGSLQRKDIMKQYLDLLQHVLDNGTDKSDRPKYLSARDENGKRDDVAGKI